MAKNVVVVGTQWGDEGKGKIVDWLTDRAKGVVRFQGGHNAGHTLVVGETVYKLNLVPSGIVREEVDCFIGNGVVLDIHHLISEIRVLEAGNIDVRRRLKISPGCPLILGYQAFVGGRLDEAKVRFAKAARSLQSLGRVGHLGLALVAMLREALGADAGDMLATMEREYDALRSVIVEEESARRSTDEDDDTESNP